MKPPYHEQRVVIFSSWPLKKFRKHEWIVNLRESQLFFLESWSISLEYSNLRNSIEIYRSSEFFKTNMPETAFGCLPLETGGKAFQRNWVLIWRANIFSRSHHRVAQLDSVPHSPAGFSSYDFSRDYSRLQRFHWNFGSQRYDGLLRWS